MLKTVEERPAGTCCPIVELRQYTLHPGTRQVLIDLFDREFVESQEAVGMTVIGQFRDLVDPDRFVWLRGFRDMPSRKRALSDFYGGPVWREHRDAANATMVDWSNVLLLRPARPGSGFSIGRPGGSEPAGLVVGTIWSFDAPVGEDVIDFFEQAVRPGLTSAGASILANFVTEYSRNDFDALPVREGEHVFVWFSRIAETASDEQLLSQIKDAAPRRLRRAPEVLRLEPTPRSRLR